MKKLIVFQSLFILTFLNFSHAQQTTAIVDYLTPKAIALNTPDALNQLITEAGKRKLVLLGEASHGTREYYEWRAEISKRLIAEHGFSFIAVEGDWASLYRLNKYVKDLPGAPGSAVEAMKSFSRWPEWMWGNTTVAALIEWMRTYNNELPAEKKVGFYGMDVYGQWEAMDDLLAYAELYVPEYYEAIAEKLACFERFGRDEWEYAHATASDSVSCEAELEALVDIIARLGQEVGSNEHFRAKQNALVVKNAEDFYRLAMQGGALSWNSRAEHMWFSVKRLLGFYGQNSRGIVWAHNTHVGDSRETDMEAYGRVNIGSLSRQELGGENVFITGFGTYRGKVNAGSQWGSPMRIMNVPRAHNESIEFALNQVGEPAFLLLFDETDREHSLFEQQIGHRAIGVVYNPHDEAGNYVPTYFTRRYDSFIFINKTNALKPVKKYNGLR
jgi:erythromycin esterase